MLFKRKHKHVHELTVGLRTQLCKECHDLQTRLCEVDGKPALFHRWLEEDRVLFNLNCFVNPERGNASIHRFRSEGVVEPGCSTEVIRETFALVEYEDGTIAKVAPEKITFTGRGGPTV